MLRSIQVLRGIAACSVALMHSVASGGVTDPGPYAIGAAGVDLFFVISGFIIATVVPGKTASQFVRARLQRIYPMWWIAVIPFFLFSKCDFAVVVSSVTLWPIFGQFTYPISAIGWTLCFEMLFYVGVTLAIVTRPLVPLSIFAVCLVLGTWSDSPLVDYLGNPIIFEFLMGVCVARLRRNELIGVASILSGILLFVVSPQFLYDSATAVDASVSFIRTAHWGLPAAMIVYGAVSLERHFAEWSRPLVTLGNASYSIYLFHLIPILIITGPRPLRFVGAVVLGLVMWHLLEKRLAKTPLGRVDAYRDRGESTVPAYPDAPDEGEQTLRRA